MRGSCIILIVEHSTRHSLSARSSKKPESFLRWEGRDRPWTTPSRRLLCPPSNASSSILGAFQPGRPPRAPSSSTWKRSTTHQVNTPLNNANQPASAEEIEVTDPTHPLFRRRFPLIVVHDSTHSAGHILVSYRGDLVLRIELWATSLAPSPQRPSSPATKLTSQAVIELVQLADQCEVLNAKPTHGHLGKALPGTPYPSHGGDVHNPYGGDR